MSNARTNECQKPLSTAEPVNSLWRRRVNQSRSPRADRKLRLQRVPPEESRSHERLYAHYLVETELAAQLFGADRDERGRLYASLYDELFRRVPDHPQLARKADWETRKKDVEASMGPVRPFLRPDITFLEIGPGDCAFARQIAALVRMVYAVDVSEAITEGADAENNFRVVISDGCRVPLMAESVDVAYSNQVMEHLHPDDAAGQLQEIFRVLTPGGTYMCITPNRLSGPHDISKYFDDVATGFHLKEYTACELLLMFHKAGFRKVEVFAGEHGGRALPLWRVRLVERALGISPVALWRAITDRMPFGFTTDIKIIATK